MKSAIKQALISQKGKKTTRLSTLKQQPFFLSSREHFLTENRPRTNNIHENLPRDFLRGACADIFRQSKAVNAFAAHSRVFSRRQFLVWPRILIIIGFCFVLLTICTYRKPTDFPAMKMANNCKSLQSK